jgi:hypothetical protein
MPVPDQVFAHPTSFTQAAILARDLEIHRQHERDRVVRNRVRRRLGRVHNQDAPCRGFFDRDIVRSAARADDGLAARKINEHFGPDQFAAHPNPDDVGICRQFARLGRGVALTEGKVNVLRFDTLFHPLRYFGGRLVDMDQRYFKQERDAFFTQTKKCQLSPAKLFISSRFHFQCSDSFPLIALPGARHGGQYFGHG